jgi:hypothetical protein
MTARRFWLVSGLLLFAPARVHAQGVMTVEIQNLQLARSLAAVVEDPTDSPIAGVLVEDVSSDWKKTLRSTTTDVSGRFTFAQVKGRDVYYLRLTIKDFNQLRVRVKVDPERGKELQLKMEISA